MCKYSDGYNVVLFEYMLISLQERYTELQYMLNVVHDNDDIETVKVKKFSM